MRFSEAELGRTFVIRLEQDEVVHEVLERFASEHDISHAYVVILGALDQGSRLVVGPKDGAVRPIEPMITHLQAPREVAGVGTIFPDEGGHPTLHMHIATGREEGTVTGCVRAGVRVWQVMEVVLQELRGSTAIRRMDKTSGFELLEPQ